ncbi:MAG: hypothetical protein LKF82_06990 [Acinetobacter populi]|jgi:hypothetical protein|uniref:hypothetical protein n=1 Tax=Acinetobacter populi TaxID=1582270 RepID=UPI002356B737|nr:hypothetical protein [Acinetobacter populi]MCH4247570.1 hypothetical protein [Acinetobacter populi]
MKVKELIEKLQNFAPELDILIANEEESIIGIDQFVKFFDITDIGTFHAETQRNDNGEVEFRFTGMPTKESRQFLNIDVTSQF